MAYCCANCFNDVEIQGYIITNSTVTATCGFCLTVDANVIETTELYDLLLPVLNLYKPTTYNDFGYELDLLGYVKQDWPYLFRITENDSIEELLRSIFLTDVDSLIGHTLVPCYETNQTQEESWDIFVHELKKVNRFFIENIIDTELLKILLQSRQKPYLRGKKFYRARISSAEKFECDEMGKPPYNYATAGRANPKGISYLYLSNDIKTTLYETRSSLLDYVTIGEFKLEEDINIINLRDNGKVSPIALEDGIGIETYMSHRRYLSRLGMELSKPIRRHDSELDYLPTQYLCEFIKSLGYDGVEYKSSLNPDGFNIAIFNDNKFKCINTKLHEVVKITYDTSEVP